MSIEIISWVTNCEWYDEETEECIKFCIRCDDVDVKDCEDAVKWHY